MRKKIKQSLTHPLISGSLIVTIGTTTANVFNYLFHLSMGRFLTPADYGILTALISFIGIFGIIAVTITTIVSRFVSSLQAVGSRDDIAYILRGSYKKVGGLAFVGLILFWPLLSPIASFLKIPDKLLLAITIIGIVLGFLGAINNGALQGLQKFKIIALVGSGGSFLRLAFALLLVYLGFGLRGAVVGFFLSFFIPYILTFIPLKKYLAHRSSVQPIRCGAVIQYSLPTLLALGGLTMFTNTDIILVKHFLSGAVAGYYAALSVIGRVIFFGTSSIGMVMFPLIAAKQAKKENYYPIFLLSLALVLLAAAGISTAYFLFPRRLIKLFYANNSYLQEAGNLGVMGIFFLLYSLASLFVNFFLSIAQTKMAPLTVIAAVLQAILIWNFHHNLREIIISSIVASGLLLMALVLYYLYLKFNDRPAKTKK